LKFEIIFSGKKQMDLFLHFFYLLPKKKITNMKDLHISYSKILTSWQSVNTERPKSMQSFIKVVFQSFSFCS